MISWVTRPMRRLTSMSPGRWGVPNTSMVPESMPIRPESALMAVVFPAPLGPRRPRISPFPISKSTWSSASVDPKRFTTSRRMATIFLSAAPDTLMVERVAGPAHGG